VDWAEVSHRMSKERIAFDRAAFGLPERIWLLRADVWRQHVVVFGEPDPAQPQEGVAAPSIGSVVNFVRAARTSIVGRP
jgi:hypothetical protein